MPPRQRRPVTVLVAEDSEMDFALLQHALQESRAGMTVKRAFDGTELTRYLKGEGKYADRAIFPFPDVIMVDLQMPGFSGFDVLEWIRDNPNYRVIPTVVMSTSNENRDVLRAYELGANTYFTKPAELHDLMSMCVVLAEYWARAELPERSGSERK